MHDESVFQFAEWDTGALAYAKSQKTDEVARYAEWDTEFHFAF